MKRSTLVVVAAAVIVAIGLIAMIAWRHGHTSGDGEAADPMPTAEITVASLQSKPLSQTITLYGDVEADPTTVLSLAAPRAVIVSRVLVHAGQTVSTGQPLIELSGSPDAELAYRQAADAAAFAQSDLERVQRLFDAKLAASDQLIAAKKAAAEAQAALISVQKQRGGGPVQTLTAPRAAIVTRVAAAAGDHVAQDGALLSLAAANSLVAQLSLEPTERRVAAGAMVTLKSPAGGAAVSSRIALVGRAPNPESKLLTASAPLGGLPLAVGAAVQGDIATGGHAGLTAPRASVVFDETGAHLFTVSGGKAHRVFVTVGPDQGDEVEITGSVKVGDVVAVEGAYELQDGMAVKVRTATAPAAAKAADE